jgi:hypothetical protein
VSSQGRGNRNPRALGNCVGDGADPACATKTAHKHCACGLSMSVDAWQCDLCVLEGTAPMEIDQAEWDGRTYPSWRNNRTRCPSPEPYILLGKAIGGKLSSADYTVAFRPRRPGDVA